MKNLPLLARSVTMKLVFSAAMVVTMASANAQSFGGTPLLAPELGPGLIFTFSSSGGASVGGSFAGMTGKLYGLTDNATSSPIAVAFFTVNGVALNELFSAGAMNGFTVSNGVITAANWQTVGLEMLFPMPITTNFDAATMQFNDSGRNGVDIQNMQSGRILSYYNDRGFSGVTYTNVTPLASVTPVPEPETYAMLLAGLGVMGLIARRRKATQA